MSMSNVLSLLKEISEECIKGRVTGRLMMTDDIRSFRSLREVALDNDPFFFGCALSDGLQEKVDSIIRLHKAEMIQLIRAGEEEGANQPQEDLRDLPFTAHWHESQKAYLVILKNSSTGFYIAPRNTVPRHEREQCSTQRKPKTAAGQKPTPASSHAVKKAQVGSGQTENRPAANVAETRQYTTEDFRKIFELNRRPEAEPAPSAKKKQKKAPTKRRKFVTLHVFQA